MTHFKKIIGCVLLCLSLATLTLSKSHTSFQKIVQISPTAFSVILNAFDQVVIYIHQKQNQTELDDILKSIQIEKNKINSVFPQDHTIFGYVNITNDFDGLLSKYGTEEGVIVLNRFEISQKITNFQDLSQLYHRYQIIAHPKMPLLYLKQVFSNKKYPHTIIFKFNNAKILNQYNQIYKRIFHFLQDLALEAYAVPIQNEQTSSISLFYQNNKIKQYQYNNMTNAQKAHQLLQQLNIDTLPLVVKLDQNLIHRVFGGMINDQILLLYRQNIDQQTLKKIKNTFYQAALHNKQSQLSYERVLFCEVSNKFYEEQFNEESKFLYTNKNGQQTDFAIMFTKTDYDRFNLKRYIFRQQTKEVSPQNIISFIEDVRMKKLQPQYKSQKEPSQEENSGALRKIVGSTFIKEVYEKPNQSIIILFIDSKDQSSYSQIQRIIEVVSQKNSQIFRNKLIFGIFDLAKNQHKLLYLKQAPQVILFDKSNKKKAKYFKIQGGFTQELLQNWIKNEVTNLEVKINTQL